MNLEHWKEAVGLVIALAGSGYSAYSWHDTTYHRISSAEEQYEELHTYIMQVDLRGSQKIRSDAILQIKARMYQMEDRYGRNFEAWPQDAKQEYRNLSTLLEEQQRALSRIEERLQSYEQEEPRMRGGH